MQSSGLKESPYMKKNSLLQIAHRASMYSFVGSLVILLCAIGPARVATASPLAYEGFQYVAGQTLPTMAGPFGWASGPWTGSGLMVDQPPTLLGRADTDGVL